MIRYINSQDTVRIGDVTATGREWLAKWKAPTPPPTKTPLELAEANLQELVDYFTISGVEYEAKYGPGSFASVSFGSEMMAALKPLDRLGTARLKVTLAEAAASEADDAD